MNCKEGDLAWVTSGSPMNAGKVVKCLKFIGPDANVTVQKKPVDDLWEVDKDMDLVKDGAVVQRRYMVDQFLRPIRPANGDYDEVTGKAPHLEAA